MKKEKGFTLIELLVVIAIIGILAAIGLSSLTSARKKARDSRRKSDLRETANALELYYSDYGYYPKESGWVDMMNVLSSSGYIAGSTKNDPLFDSGRKYCYIAGEGVGEAGLFYKMGAKLEVANDLSDDKDGGTDDELFEMGNALGTSELQNKVGTCGE